MTTPPVPRPLPVTLVPGVLYSPLTKRARVEGSGLDVWEIIAVYELVGRDHSLLRKSFDWLAPEQLDAALTFAEKNAEFVAADLNVYQETPEQLHALWTAFPFTKPPHLR